jgi:hypothetical protein
MDHDQIVKELEKLDVRIADANERITRYREKVKDLEERGYKAEFERTLLRECEDLLVMQWNLQEKLLQLLRSMR